MAVSGIDSLLYRDQFSTPAMREVFDDTSTLQKFLDMEAALARAEAKLGIIPESAAAQITKSADMKLYDFDDMRAEMARTSHPIVPLVRAMAAQCEKQGDKKAGEYVHWGATTQDVMDTGLVLQMKDAVDLVREGLVQRTPRGRMLATDGWKALGMTPPPAALTGVLTGAPDQFELLAGGQDD